MSVLGFRGVLFFETFFEVRALDVLFDGVVSTFGFDDFLVTFGFDDFLAMLVLLTFGLATFGFDAFLAALGFALAFALVFVFVVFVFVVLPISCSLRDFQLFSR